MASKAWFPAHLHDLIEIKQQPQNSTLCGLARFAANGLIPLLLQLLETTPGVMAKPIQHLKSSLRF